jgi:SulP family sulfate permease
MPHRAHLFSLRFAHALRESLLDSPYSAARLGKDCLAGLTVGLVAIPLAMALAIASGVPPQYGLYSAMIAGFLIPLTGGSRYSVSGPTAAFVVILFPIVQQYGFAGLLLATMLSGGMLVLMAVLRLGRYIEYIPQSVTLGFTCGIAIVIAVLQLPEFLNFAHQDLPPHFAEKALVIAQRIGQFDASSLLVGVSTLAVLLLWPRLHTAIPPHLPALLAGGVLGWWLTGVGSDIATIGNSFQYLAADGSLANGIPASLPDFELPWTRHLPGDPELAFTWQGAQDLLGAAFAIAMLGAIESLLCAVVLDGMSGIKHSANSELLGQGIGNLITPLFGGITATAAIARSAANFKAGAQTPLAAAIHALVVLLAVLTLAPLLAYLPMASMAALLLVVAWTMSEAHKAVHLVKTSPPSDVLVFATCLSLTVLFDMVIAISAGILLASVLFVKQMAEMTRLTDVSANAKYVRGALPAQWKVFRINGPLFFAAADRIFGELGTLLANHRGIILSMDGVTILDAGGLAAMHKLIDHCGKTGVKLVLTDFEFQPLKALARSGFKPDGICTFTYPTLDDALKKPFQFV